MTSGDQAFLDLCKSTGLLILNGGAGQDKSVGRTTCQNVTHHSTVDYAIASPTIFPKIEDFLVDIYDEFLSNHHCPFKIEP